MQVLLRVSEFARQATDLHRSGTTRHSASGATDAAPTIRPGRPPRSRVGSQAGQRGDDAGPSVAVGEPERRRAARRPERVVGEHDRKRAGHRFDVVRGDAQPRARVVDDVGEHVAGGADGGQPGPEVVEHAGPPGQAGLGHRLRRNDADIGFQQELAPVVVGHPRAEVHMTAGHEPERSGPGLQRLRGRHLRDTPSFELETHEEQTRLGYDKKHTYECVEHTERIEPIPSAATPEDHLAGAVDPGELPAPQDRFRPADRRHRGAAERHHVDELAQVRIVLVRNLVETPTRGEHADPEVALTLGCADEEVTHIHQLIERTDLVGLGTIGLFPGHAVVLLE